MTGGCWVAHPVSNITATISDRNFMHYTLAALTPCARWQYNMVCHSWTVNEDQRHHTGRSLGQLFSLLWTQTRPGWLVLIIWILAVLP